LFKNVIIAVLFSIKIKIPMQRLKSYILFYIEDGLIVLVEDRDQIEIDALNNMLNLSILRGDRRASEKMDETSCKISEWFTIQLYSVRKKTPLKDV
jgi:hypothetical protein